MIKIVRSHFKDDNPQLMKVFSFVTTLVADPDDWNAILPILKPLRDIPECLQETYKQHGCAFLHLHEPWSFDLEKKLKEAGFDVKADLSEKSKAKTAH